jgi:phosphatidylglycerol lysyltransferase
VSALLLQTSEPAVGRATVVVAVLTLIGLGLLLVPRPAVLARLIRAGGNITAQLAPRFLAFTTFLGGVILLFSGATPARSGRIGWVTQVLPLPIVELSAYFVSIAGVALILLARGIQRRLDAAYHLTLWVLAGGVVFAMTSAFDIGQALLLALTFAALLPSRRYFDRRSSLFDERFTFGWFAAIGGVVTATAALAYLAYGREIVGTQVFWEYGANAQAPRAARALTLAIVALLAISLARLLRPSRVRAGLHPVDRCIVERIVHASPAANAHLALLGDKELLVNESGTALLMFGVSGLSRVVMGDPIGPVRDGAALIDTFIAQCRREGSWPVFYRASPQLLYRYLDYGLAAVKLGEVARVPLGDFSLDGSHRRNLRRVWRKVVDAGCSFELVPVEEVPPLLATLRHVSSEWLAGKRAREKSFSLGRFTESFVSGGPVAIVRQHGEVVAFGTLWPSGQRAEVEIDLMRYLDDAPPGVMRYLIVEAMLWAKSQGYAQFNLGMAPLSGIASGLDSPIWNQIVSAVRIGGERYYNFQGIREFKAWFYPEWEPSYLVSPGGTKRPLIVANIATLISGGASGMLAR